MSLAKTTTSSSFSQSSGALFLLPVGLIVLSLLVVIFVVPGSYAQITSRYDAFQKDRERRDVLQKKLTVLQSTSPAALQLAPQTVIVMPEKNPVLPFISQLKELALAENVTITDIKSASISEFQDGIKKLEFAVTLDAAEFQPIVNVLNSLATRAPVATIDQVDMRNLETSKQAGVKLTVYWSPLPESLPAITDPFPPFSPEELASLDRVSKLTPPTFSELSPESANPRENPFN